MSTQIIIVIGILLVLVFLFIFKITQKRETEELKELISNLNLFNIEVKYSESQFSKVRISYGLASKIKMYFNEDIIILCPIYKNLFSLNLKTRLPIILSNENIQFKQPALQNKFTEVQKIELTNLGNIMIRLKTGQFFDSYTEIDISFINKKDLNLFRNNSKIYTKKSFFETL